VIAAAIPTVSVPLRGIGSEKQLNGEANYIARELKVSVPLRGIGSEKP